MAATIQDWKNKWNKKNEKHFEKRDIVKTYTTPRETMDTDLRNRTEEQRIEDAKKNAGKKSFIYDGITGKMIASFSKISDASVAIIVNNKGDGMGRMRYKGKRAC